VAWGGVLFLALLVAMPNVATATVLHPTLHVAPFHGTLHVASIVQKSGCGGTASLVVPPKFNFTTGVGKAYGKSAAKGCGPPGFSDYGVTEATTGFDSLPVVAPSPAPGNFSFSLNENISWNLSATPQSPFGGAFAWASAEVDLEGHLYDLTNASIRGGLIYSTVGITTNGTATGNVTGFQAGPLGFRIFNSTTLTVPGHHYIFQFFVEIWEWTYAPSGTSTHASARINMATGGHNVTLLNWSLN
jgi:hypothetical protein